MLAAYPRARSLVLPTLHKCKRTLPRPRWSSTHVSLVFLLVRISWERKPLLATNYKGRVKPGGRFIMASVFRLRESECGVLWRLTGSCRPRLFRTRRFSSMPGGSHYETNGSSIRGVMMEKQKPAVRPLEPGDPSEPGIPIARGLARYAKEHGPPCARTSG